MTTTDCASCADERAAGAAYCEACGNELKPPAPVTNELPVAAVTTGEKGCPHCGKTGSIGTDGYCENCGMLAVRPRDHIEIDLPGAAAISDRGKRHHRNEDAVWLEVRGRLIDAVVCDGVSSSFDPDVASQTAVDAAGSALDPVEPESLSPEQARAKFQFLSPEQHAGLLAEHLSAAIGEAGTAVAELARNGDPRRAVSNPASTIVAATIRDQYVDVGWVGDSRAYWLPGDGPAEQLTEDDSWATHAIAMGADPAAALRDPKAHAITAWLGADAGPVRPRTAAFTVTAPGHLVLCSDGLWNYLPDPVVFAETVRSALAGKSLIAAARALVDHANAAGGADNITVVLVPVSPDGPGPTPRPATAEPAATEPAATAATAEPVDKE
jgi:serine/threonine protein phosphatase PrpC